MGRKTIEIPPAGESQAIELTGQSVIVESVPNYSVPEDIPLLSFNEPGYQLPAKIGNKFQFPEKGEFNNLVITGTSESAGDSLTVWTSKNCAEDELNTNVNLTTKSIAGTTFFIQMDGNPKQIQENDVTNSAGDLATSIYISARNNDINYSWNFSPGTDGLQSHLLVAGRKPIEIVGIDWILTAEFINAVLGQTPNLIITPRYYG